MACVPPIESRLMQRKNQERSLRRRRINFVRQLLRRSGYILFVDLSPI